MNCCEVKLHSLRVLFVGDLNRDTRSRMRMACLESFVREIVSISSVPVPFIAGIHKESLLARFLHRIRLPLDSAQVNSAVVEIINADSEFDLVWIDKAPVVRPEAINFIRSRSSAKIISVSEDDMFALHNRSWYYQRTLPLFDVVYTTKPYNISELRSLGARRVELFIDSYYGNLHKEGEPVTWDDKHYDVSFVGTFEQDRADQLSFLAANGVDIHVFGNGWDKFNNDSENLHVHRHAVSGEDLVETIKRTKINLGFLRKMNRDQATSRTMEIPACGGFLLAERTDLHVSYFDEGVEAEFFSSAGELLEKVRYYLSRPAHVRAISTKGLARCVKSGYEMSYQVKNILANA